MTEHLIHASHYLYAFFLIHHFTGKKTDSESLGNFLKVVMLINGRTET